MQGVLDIVSEYGWDFVSGTWLTIQLVVIAAFLGLLIAVPVALARLSENRVVHGLATAYSLFFRARRSWCRSSSSTSGSGSSISSGARSSGPCCAKPMSAR